MATRPLLREFAVRDLLREIPDPPASILEVGYGGGDMLCNLRTWFPQASIYGFDFSEEAFACASQSIADIHLYPSQDDITSTQYDLLCAFEVLEHIEQDQESLKTWQQLLCDGGTLLLSVPAHSKRWGPTDIAAGHYRRYERSVLHERLHECGFSDVKIINYGYPFTIILDQLLRHLIKQRNSSIPADQNARTQHSGMIQKTGHAGQLFRYARRYKKLFFPCYLIQRLFYTNDWSSAYLVRARKSSTPATH